MPILRLNFSSIAAQALVQSAKMLARFHPFSLLQKVTTLEACHSHFCKIVAILRKIDAPIPFASCLQPLATSCIVWSDMPKAGHDYDKAKGMLLKGLTIKQISDETGIPYGSLQRHALRHHWRTDQTRVQTLVSETVNDRLQKQCVAWVMSIAEKADATLEALGQYDFAGQVHKLKPNEWVQALATLNNIARQNYGLDAGNAASPRVQVQVQVLTQAAQSMSDFASDVIDLEPAARSVMSDAHIERDAQGGDAQSA